MASDMGEREEHGTGSANGSRRRVRAVLDLIRPETWLLLFGLLWTVGAKVVVLRSQRPDAFVAEALDAVLPDVVFFAGAALLFALLSLLGRPAIISRLILVISAVILAWSMMNAAWLIATGVQLQTGLLKILIEDPGFIWPMVSNHLRHNVLLAAPTIGTLVAGIVWIGYRLLRPRLPRRSRRGHLRNAAVLGALVVVALAGVWGMRRDGRVVYSGEVIGFSSHWHGVVQFVARAVHTEDVSHATRVLPRSGDRALTPPAAERTRPNVVIVLLESVSYPSTSFADAGLNTTPELVRLAAEGASFTSTRVPIPQTSKAFWAALTGSIPDTQPDHAETVLVDHAYESVASVLASDGYRSAFFQMSQGSFQCAPGLFANLGFDRAWFRENLGDPSAHLGYMNGDDFRMLDPMFDWVDGSPDPFLLVTITSVAHDPYELPQWYEHEAADGRYERYLEAVRYTDHFVGAVRERLEARGMFDDTIFCVIGDHGEGFRAESKRGRWAPFEEVLHVPWTIRYPRRIEAGRRVTAPTSQLDVTPTLLATMGWNIEGASFDGVDALGELDPGRRMFFSCWYEDSPVGFLDGQQKYIYWPRRKTLFHYDLARDPGETTPINIDGPAKDEHLLAIEEWTKTHRFTIPARRFRERFLYEHWRAFSDGRYSRAYYVP